MGLRNHALDTQATLLACLQQQDAVLVRVRATQGSVPREAGAWLAVLADTLAAPLGTIGGGRLEWDAIGHARALLGGAALPLHIDYALGPSLGQCCGGRVQLEFERVSVADCARLARLLLPAQVPVAVFGGGHVGRALVAVLATLPMQVAWIDSRDAIFPDELRERAACEHSDPVQAAVAGLPGGSRVVIMSFSHAEDLAIVAACLQRLRQRDDLPYIGLIGSRTKWARFQARLGAQGFTAAELARITCPIGITGIADKRPEVIAVAVAAQLLQVSQQPPPPGGAACDAPVSLSPCQEA